MGGSVQKAEGTPKKKDGNDKKTQGQ